jgi:hypothetical protein
MGLNLSSTLGLYRLDQQVACQRYRQTRTDAKTSFRDVVAMLKDAFPAQATLATARA